MDVDAKILVERLALQRNAALDSVAALEAKVIQLTEELKSVKGNGHGVVMHKEIDSAGNPTV